LLEIIDAKAEGNALCAAQLSLAARRSGMDADAIAKLPRGLSALYRAILQRRFDPHSAEWMVVRDVLEMVLATRAALPIELAASARGHRTQYTTQQAIESISDLLHLQNDTQTLAGSLPCEGEPERMRFEEWSQRIQKLEIAELNPARASSSRGRQRLSLRLRRKRVMTS
jgi:hypothetical protein